MGVIPIEGVGGDEDAGPPPASEKVLRTIPTIVVTEEDLTDDTNKECCICLEPNEVGSKVSRLPCGHLFHCDCIANWISKHCTCPVCRYELETSDEAFNKGRTERMKDRKPRYHMYELERMGAKDLTRIAKTLKISTQGTLDKKDVVERIVSSGKIDIIPVNSSCLEYTMRALESMKVKDLKMIMSSVGVSYREEDVIERKDLVNILINSGRVAIIDDDDGEDSAIMGIDEDDTTTTTTTTTTTATNDEVDKKKHSTEGTKKRERETEEKTPNLGARGLRRENLERMTIGELKALARDGGVDS